MCKNIIKCNKIIFTNFRYIMNIHFVTQVVKTLDEIYLFKMKIEEIEYNNYILLFNFICFLKNYLSYSKIKCIRL